MSPAMQLEQGLLALGLDLAAGARQKLLDYAALLDKWNRIYQLTAVRDASLAISHHLLDSLAVLPFLNEGRVLDVGSGGGMPGVPLAIARPQWPVVLLDSNTKKSAFLQQAAIELGLANVAVHCGRVEKYLPAELFATITARAFGTLSDLLGLTRHLLSHDGQWLAMKGRWPAEEIAVLPTGTVVKEVHRLNVPGVDGERHLVVIGGSAARH